MPRRNQETCRPLVRILARSTRQLLVNPYGNGRSEKSRAGFHIRKNHRTESHENWVGTQIYPKLGTPNSERIGKSGIQNSVEKNVHFQELSPCQFLHAYSWHSTFA